VAARRITEQRRTGQTGLAAVVRALDLTSTSVQITYAITGVALYAAWRGLALARTTQDVVSLLGALMPLLLLVLAKRFGDNAVAARFRYGPNGRE
jgi:hypothetical protein